MNCSKKLTLKEKVLLNDGAKCKLVELNDIRFFETCGNYSKTYYKDGMLLIHRTLNHIESRLPERYFFRANRQFIVNFSRIERVQLLENSTYRIVMCCGKEIDVSRRRSLEFKESLSL
jgi:two-component system, LytTR family, response regulator